MNIEEKLLGQIKITFPELLWKTSKYVGTGKVNHIIILDNNLLFRFPRKKRVRRIT